MDEILPHQNPGACEACSDFPAPHFFTYVSATLEAWRNGQRGKAIGRMEEWMLSQKWLQKTTDAFVYALFSVLHLLHLARFSDDLSRAHSNRSRVVWEEARARGIDMKQIMLLSMNTDVYRAKIAGSWKYFQSIPIPEPLHASAFATTDDKLLFKELMRRYAIPVARGYEVVDLEGAHNAWKILKAPVVVKPRVGSRGRHTTPLVSTESDLEAAFRSAQVLCRYVLIEEHFFGPLCRATVVDGRVAGFLRKRSPSVVGDGVSTIRELIDEKNKTKNDRVYAIEWGYEHTAHLARQGLTAESIPEKGNVLELSRHSGRQVGGDSREMPHAIHPKLRAYIERAARVLALPVIGFDLIIPDPEADPDTQHWGFLEANSLPFIDLHYSPLEGTPSNPAAAVWDLWKQRA